MGDKINIQYLPPEFIALQQEIFNHPELLGKLATMHDGVDTWDKFAVILTYVDVLVDGEYNKEDVLKLADIAVRKLKEKRTQIILLN